MVEPPSEEDKRAAANWVKAGVVALVGASAGLIVVSGGGSLAEVALAVVAGLAVGVVLLLYLGRVL